MEPIRVTKPYIMEPVVDHNSDRPHSNGSSFHSSQDKDDCNHFSMDRNWEHGLGIIFIVYFDLSIKYWFINF